MYSPVSAVPSDVSVTGPTGVSRTCCMSPYCLGSMARARIGCSGWVYKDWRGVVYPEKLPAKKGFGYYAGLFATVEINTTFYRFPPGSPAELWCRQAPEDFVYAMKLGQFGSHRMKLRDAVSWLPNHM